VTNRPETFLTGLSVFHQLHCLNRIGKLIHPDRYPWQLAVNLSAEETRIHDNHCADLVRQCKGLRKGCRCLVNKIVFDGDAIYAHAELMYLVVLCSRSF
jgi:hypothetical protein